jgi:hypothetical protein
MNSLNLYIETLRSIGANLKGPAAESAINSVELELSIVMIPLLRAFYLKHNGASGDNSLSMWSALSIEDLRDCTIERRKSYSLMSPEGESPIAYNDLYCFCDALVDMPTYLMVGNPAISRCVSFGS